MARNTLLSSSLALIISITAIILGLYLCVDGIRHPAIGSEATFMVD